MQFPGGFHIKHQHPLSGWFVPEDFRIAVAAGDLFDHRILSILRKRTTVVAVGDTLNGWIACSRVDKDKWRLAVFSKTAGVVPVNDRTAAEHRSLLIGI